MCFTSIFKTGKQILVLQYVSRGVNKDFNIKDIALVLLIFTSPYYWYSMFILLTSKTIWICIYFFHQRTADDRASKAAELEQKVALLEVMAFLSSFIWAFCIYPYSRPCSGLSSKLNYITKWIILSLLHAALGWMCFPESRTARYGSSCSPWAKKSSWRCKSSDSGSKSYNWIFLLHHPKYCWDVFSLWNHKLAAMICVLEIGSLLR